MSAMPESGRTGMRRPLGFFLLMLGFGLRLETPWQGVAWILLVAGGVIALLGLVELRAREHTTASVPRHDGE